MILINGIPADFILDSSYRSANPPINITDEIRTDNGSANGIKWIDKYPINSNIVNIPRPFPEISSMYFQKN